ncbi:MAG: aromatic amino acid lyase, partial [Sphingobacterium sp.]
MEKFLYGSGHLTSSIALAIAKGEVKGEISAEVKAAIDQSAAYVRQIVERGQVVYGINTGFGPLCTTLIDADQTQVLQENILKSHAVGMGEPIANDLAKVMLILKVHALAKGFSGVQYSTLERIIWHIEQDVIPVVPKQGSVGASGDLAPLSHLFLPLIGLGKVNVEGEIYTTADILAQHGLKPVQLGAKEGLALINGTQFMAAHGVKAVSEFNRVLQNADIIAALMIEGLNGSIKP